MKVFLKEVWETFLPSKWDEICGRSSGKGVGFLTKVLVFAFVVMILLAVPNMIKLPGEISNNLAKFDVLQLNGNFTMSSPIKIPKSDPFFVFDTSGAYTELTKERVLITKDKIFYRPFIKAHYVNTEQLKDLKKNRENVKRFLAALVFFILPSLLFYAFIAVWLKYFLMILMLSIILFVLLDLTHWRRTWKELFVISCYVSLIPVLAEVVVGAIAPKMLVPVLSIAGIVQLYLVPVVILCVLAIGASLCVYYNKQEAK
ncbi:MAG: DUF1189 family protein [Candidatus Woesearchaeota archaeon]